MTDAVQIVAQALDETPMGLNTAKSAEAMDDPWVPGENWPKEWRQFWDEPWTVRGAKACLRALAEAGLLKEEALQQ